MARNIARQCLRIAARAARLSSQHNQHGALGALGANSSLDNESGGHRHGKGGIGGGRETGVSRRRGGASAARDIGVNEGGGEANGENYGAGASAHQRARKNGVRNMASASNNGIEDNGGAAAWRGAEMKQSVAAGEIISARARRGVAAANRRRRRGVAAAASSAMNNRRASGSAGARSSAWRSEYQAASGNISVGGGHQAWRRGGSRGIGGINEYHWAA